MKKLKRSIKAVFILMAFSLSLLSYARVSDEIQHREKLNVQLLEVVKSGYTNDVFKLLKRGADVNERDSYGRTTLHLASRYGYKEVVQLLLDNNATVNAKIIDNERVDKRTALHLASIYGYTEIVQLLLEYGADINAKAWLTTIKGTLRNMRNFYQRGEPVFANGTALHFASSNGYPEMVQLLLEYGADVNAKTWYCERTALHFAIEEGHTEVVRLLIENNADLNVGDRDEQTAVCSSSLPYAKVSDDEYQTQKELSAQLRAMSAVGNVDEVSRLLKRDVDINAGNFHYRWTALHFAIKEGHTEVAQLLIENNADLNVGDRDGWTPLHFASWKGHTEMVQLLLDHGADVKARTRADGLTPIHFASRYGHKESVQLLIENHADVNAKTRSDWTPLHSASFGHLEVTQLLIENGADVNAKNSEGETALHLASEEGHTEVVRLLIENNADLNVRDRDDRTAVRLARRNKNTEIVDLLQLAGAEGLWADIIHKIKN